MNLVLLALAAFAYRGLLVFEPQGNLTRELEEWFFIPTETSALVVVLLASWLVYRRRQRLAALAGSPVAWSLAAPLLATGGGIFVWSVKASAPELQAVSLLFVGLGLAALLCGRRGVSVVLLPALLLLFALPMPPPLLAEAVYTAQLWTADYAGWLLYLIGESAYVSGDRILMAEDQFAVIEGCSGLRSVQTLTMVGLLLVELFGRRGLHAVAILASAPIVAFALNGLRVLALILNPRSDVVAIHNLQGVVILLAGLAILYVLDGVLERYSKPRAELAAEAEAAAAAGEERPAAAGVAGLLTPPRIAASLLAMLALCSLLLPAWPPAPPAATLGRTDLPNELGPWRGVETPLPTESFLGSIGYRTRYERRYELDEAGGAAVELFVLVGSLEQRYRSPISPKTVPPSSGWIVEESLPGDDGSSHVLRSGTRRVLVRHWYEGTAGLPDEVLRSLLSLDTTPWHRERDVLVVRLSTDVVGATRGSLERAQKRLASFEEALEPSLERLRMMLLRKRVS